MWSRERVLPLLVLAGLLLLAAGPARATDEEGCLFCHGFDLRSAAPGRDGRDLRVWEPPGGAHEALYCSDCHPDAGRAPHAAGPGSAQCIGECHGQSAAAKETHRRASFGGLTEPHRGLSSPGAPCRLCHGGTDRPGGTAAILIRCAACHPGERDSEARGVHARFTELRGRGMCIGCHEAHPPGPGAAKASCGGAGCHPSVTGGMKRLAGHQAKDAKGRTAKRAGQAVLVLGFAFLGLIVGRRMSPASSDGGGAG